MVLQFLGCRCVDTDAELIGGSWKEIALIFNESFFGYCTANQRVALELGSEVHFVHSTVNEPARSQLFPMPKSIFNNRAVACTSRWRTRVERNSHLS